MNIDFNEKDGILAYFSNKNNIPPDIPVETSFFFDIQLEDLDPPFIKDKYSEQEDNLDNFEQYNSEASEGEEEEKMIPLK